MIYDEGLNSNFCDFIAEKIEYTLYISLNAFIGSDLCDTTFMGGNVIMVKPLFNFTEAISSNPLDHTENKKVFIMKNEDDTMLSFRSNQPILDYEEIMIDSTFDGIKYTLHYTYDRNTGEPAPYKKTENGNVTDQYGCYIDSEVA